MRIGDWLTAAIKQLLGAGIGSARLDALILLEDILNMDRAAVLAHPEVELSKKTEVKLNKKIAQRSNHTPLAYIRGKAEFYGRELTINQHVLVPRPETETLIDLLKKLPLPTQQPIIADIGTGSGAIAITAKLEFPNAEVVATDIDPNALKIARQNAKRLKADIQFLQGDLLDTLTTNNQQPTIVLANLPYVPERYAINQAAEHEPRHAIFGGKDGLNLYRRLWQQIAAATDKPKFVLTESLPPQHDDLTKMAGDVGYKLIDGQDFIQVFVKS